MQNGDSMWLKPSELIIPFQDKKAKGSTAIKLSGLNCFLNPYLLTFSLA